MAAWALSRGCEGALSAGDAARGVRAQPALGDAQAYDGLIACGRAAIRRIDPGNTLEGRPFHTTTIHESHDRHTDLPATKSRGAHGILSVAAAKRVAVSRTRRPQLCHRQLRQRGDGAVGGCGTNTIKRHLAASSSAGSAALAQAVVG